MSPPRFPKKTTASNNQQQESTSEGHSTKGRSPRGKADSRDAPPSESGNNTGKKKNHNSNQKKQRNDQGQQDSSDTSGRPSYPPRRPRRLQRRPPESDGQSDSIVPESPNTNGGDQGGRHLRQKQPAVGAEESSRGSSKKEESKGSSTNSTGSERPKKLPPTRTTTTAEDASSAKTDSSIVPPIENPATAEEEPAPEPATVPPGSVSCTTNRKAVLSTAEPVSIYVHDPYGCALLGGGDEEEYYGAEVEREQEIEGEGSQPYFEQQPTTQLSFDDTTEGSDGYASTFYAGTPPPTPPPSWGIPPPFSGLPPSLQQQQLWSGQASSASTSSPVLGAGVGIPSHHGTGAYPYAGGYSYPSPMYPLETAGTSSFGSSGGSPLSPHGIPMPPLSYVNSGTWGPAQQQSPALSPVGVPVPVPVPAVPLSPVALPPPSVQEELHQEESTDGGSLSCENGGAERPVPAAASSLPADAELPMTLLEAASASGSSLDDPQEVPVPGQSSSPGAPESIDESSQSQAAEPERPAQVSEPQQQQQQGEQGQEQEPSTSAGQPQSSLPFVPPFAPGAFPSPFPFLGGVGSAGFPFFPRMPPFGPMKVPPFGGVGFPFPPPPVPPCAPRTDPMLDYFRSYCQFYRAAYEFFCAAAAAGMPLQPEGMPVPYAPQPPAAAAQATEYPTSTWGAPCTHQPHTHTEQQCLEESVAESDGATLTLTTDGTLVSNEPSTVLTPSPTPSVSGSARSTPPPGQEREQAKRFLKPIAKTQKELVADATMYSFNRISTVEPSKKCSSLLIALLKAVRDDWPGLLEENLGPPNCWVSYWEKHTPLHFWFYELSECWCCSLFRTCDGRVSLYPRNEATWYDIVLLEDEARTKTIEATLEALDRLEADPSLWQGFKSSVRPDYIRSVSLQFMEDYLEARPFWRRQPKTVFRKLFGIHISRHCWPKGRDRLPLSASRVDLKQLRDLDRINDSIDEWITEQNKTLILTLAHPLQRQGDEIMWNYRRPSLKYSTRTCVQMSSASRGEFLDLSPNAITVRHTICSTAIALRPSRAPKRTPNQLAASACCVFVCRDFKIVPRTQPTPMVDTSVQTDLLASEFDLDSASWVPAPTTDVDRVAEGTTMEDRIPAPVIHSREPTSAVSTPEGLHYSASASSSFSSTPPVSSSSTAADKKGIDSRARRSLPGRENLPSRHSHTASILHEASSRLRQEGDEVVALPLPPREDVEQPDGGETDDRDRAKHSSPSSSRTRTQVEATNLLLC